jgi:signal transduction histidine kinase
VLVPLAIAWYQAPPRGWSRGRALEAALMIGSVAGLSELALRTDRPLTYLVFPALIWAALRFGQRGATLAIAVAALFTVWETTHYIGPFVFDSITHSVLTTQLYIAVSAMTTLCLAAVVSEREEFGGRLRASRSRLVHAADTERQRLEHNLHDGAQQRLMAVVMRLRLGAERVEQSPETAAPLFEEAETELLGAIDDLRQLAHGIHPTVLTQFGLADAIKDVAARSAVPVELLELPATRLDGTAEATAYYVISEAVTNAQKHARATSIGVRATLASHSLHIEVVDDGAGGANESGGSGLQGLRDRVEALGGEFEVDSPAGRGTRIAAAIPATAVAA